jgi:hypothetical protein
MENQTKESSFIADQKSRFVWTSGSDVQLTWRKHGWLPPSEYREDFLFPKNRNKSNDS